MRKIRELDATEVRVLGALLEKERVTPDHYPMTINALIAACNQKSNREPVTELSETEVVEALDRLRKDVLAWRSDGARVERWSQSISRRLELTSASKAILTLLMLRGPQTPGQLRSRSGRLHAFSDLAEVETCLQQMAAGDAPLAVALKRQPGTKEHRWAHRLGLEPDLEEQKRPHEEAIQHRAVVVGLVWNSRRELLFCRMDPNRGVFPGQWGFPGGGIEAGETMVEALHRELREELGIGVSDVRPAFFKDCLHEKLFPDGSSRPIYMIFLLFHCRAEDEELRLCPEFVEYAWVKETDIGSMEINAETADTLERLGRWERLFSSQ